MQADVDLTRNPRPPSSVDRMIALFTRNSILRMTDVHQYMNIRHFEELMRIFQEGKREDASGFDIDKVGLAEWLRLPSSVAVLRMLIIDVLSHSITNDARATTSPISSARSLGKCLMVPSATTS